MPEQPPPPPNPNLPDTNPPPQQSLPYSLSTLGIHGDDPINSATDVAPPLHVSTTFRYPNDPSLLKPVADLGLADRAPTAPTPADSHIYSRATAPNASRLELILTQLLGGAPCLTYASGLAAFHALLVYLNPKVVAIGAGYHGCHGVLEIYQKLTKCKIVDLFDDYCEHLLVREQHSGRVIGTYRVLTPVQAKRIGSTYSDMEFDLTRLTPRQQLPKYRKNP